jgi:CDP-paratose 2-epimerase
LAPTPDVVDFTRAGVPEDLFEGAYQVGGVNVVADLLPFRFFGESASTGWMTERLKTEVASFRHYSTDIRDAEQIDRIFEEYGSEIELVIHAAAQPSHDWAAGDPITDFTVNANGTSTMLEATRRFAPDAVFIYMSTNKVYGDRPNQLPLVELETRWEVDPNHEFIRGIPETMSIDGTLHSLFGVSKVAADVLGTC